MFVIGSQTQKQPSTQVLHSVNDQNSTEAKVLYLLLVLGG